MSGPVYIVSYGEYGDGVCHDSIWTTRVAAEARAAELPDAFVEAWWLDTADQASHYPRWGVAIGADGTLTVNQAEADGRAEPQEFVNDVDGSCNLYVTARDEAMAVNEALLVRADRLPQAGTSGFAEMCLEAARSRVPGS